jgi:mono/diheme cytochrome c family protein
MRATGGTSPLGVAALLLGLLGCQDEGPPPASTDPFTTVLQATIPAEYSAGQLAFDANCATCHGDRGLGTERGPPLVHIIYEPSHHGDLAFILAAEQGVRAHHRGFGDMPPQPGVDRETVAEIVAYIRYLQRLVGIE